MKRTRHTKPLYAGRHMAPCFLLLCCLLACGPAGCSSESGENFLTALGSLFESQETVPNELAAAREAYSAGQYFDAQRMYEAYLQLHPQGEARWEAWTRVLEVSRTVERNTEKSASVLEAMYLEYGQEPERAFELLSRLALLHERARNHQRAVEAWHKALSLPDLPDAERAQAGYNLSKVYSRLAHYDLALEAAQECVQVASETAGKADCLYQSGLVLSYMDNLDGAEATFRELVALPGLSEERMALASFQLADILEQLERPDEAVAIYRSILTSYPNPKAVETRLSSLGAK